MPNAVLIYDLHPLVVVGAFAASFVAVCWAAIILSRPVVQSRFHRQPGLNELVGDFLQYFGVIYGLLLGLLAVATYQNLSDVDKTVGNEASSLAALYRDVSGYPEPKRSELEGLLRDYTRYVIDEAWPLQRKGIVPAGAVKRIADFQARLVGFEPETKSQEALHDAAMRQFNTFYEYRRTRLHSVIRASQPSCGTRSRSELSSISSFCCCSISAPAWWRPVLLSGNVDLADRLDGSPVSRRNGCVSLSIRAGLRSVDETLTKAIAPR
jgi:Protein of unknown function (DUF4239)